MKKSVYLNVLTIYYEDLLWEIWASRFGWWFWIYLPMERLSSQTAPTCGVGNAKARSFSWDCELVDVHWGNAQEVPAARSSKCPSICLAGTISSSSTQSFWSLYIVVQTVAQRSVPEVAGWSCQHQQGWEDDPQGSPKILQTPGPEFTPYLPLKTAGWCPPSDVCWFINPMKSIVISAINHSEMGVINQLS